MRRGCADYGASSAVSGQWVFAMSSVDCPKGLADGRGHADGR